MLNTLHEEANTLHEENAQAWKQVTSCQAGNILGSPWRAT